MNEKWMAWAVFWLALFGWVAVEVAAFCRENDITVEDDDVEDQPEG